MTRDFYYIMNMMTKMNVIEIASYIDNEVGMDIARIVDNCNVIIHADRDFLGNKIIFHDYLFYEDAIYSYIGQYGFNKGKARFGTNTHITTDEPDYGYECFNRYDIHGRNSEFDYDTGMRVFDMEILKTAVKGLKKALKVVEQPKLTVSNEVEFMDI